MQAAERRREDRLGCCGDLPDAAPRGGERSPGRSYSGALAVAPHFSFLSRQPKVRA